MSHHNKNILFLSIGVFYFFISPAFAQKSDNVPLVRFSGSGDTVGYLNKTINGSFGSSDVLFSLFNTNTQQFIQSWHFGSANTDKHSDLIIQSGNCYLLGSSTVGGFNDIILAKLRPDGSYWSRNIAAPLIDNPERLQVFDDKIVVLANSGSSGGELRGVLAEFDTSGQFLQMNEFGFGNDFFPSSVVADDNHYYVSGNRYFSGGKWKATVVAINKANLQLEWTRGLKLGEGTEIQTLFLEDSSLYFAGNVDSSGVLMAYIGQIDVSNQGELMTHYAFRANNIFTANSIVVKQNEWQIYGAKRTFSINEIALVVIRLDVTTGVLEASILSDGNRTTPTDIYCDTNGCLTAGYQALSNGLQQASVSAWDTLSGKCYHSSALLNVAPISDRTVDTLFPVLSTPQLSVSPGPSMVLESSQEDLFTACLTNELKEEKEAVDYFSILTTPTGLIFEPLQNLHNNQLRLIDLTGRILYETTRTEQRIPLTVQVPSVYIVALYTTSGALLQTEKVVVAP